jgi:hypothetical protein
VKNKNKGGFLFLFLILLLAGIFGFGKPSLAFSQVIINEVMYSPEGADAKHEWLEIFNSGVESINLSDWILFEANTKHALTLYQGDFDLLPGGYAIIADDASTFKNDHPEYDGTVIDSVFSLSNSGELFSIKNNFVETISEISYTNALGADGNGFSIERDELGSLRESYVSGGTPGEKNSEKPKPKVYSNRVTINELLPAPSSGNEEFVELYNPTAEAIDISGYLLKDASKTGKYVFPDGAEIKSLDYLVIYKKDFKFALNNSGVESVTLFDPDEKTVSAVSYSGSKTNVSYNFNGNVWHWSHFLTPSKENEFNNLPEVSKKKDNKIYANVYADFSAKGYDADKDKLKFTWDFGDGHKSYLKKTRHKFKKAGKYKVALRVSDGSEDKVETFNIKVEKFPKSKVKIISVSPNPAGKDSNSEFITLQNISKKKINLKSWIVATGSQNLYNHPVLKDIFIKPGETLKLTRDFSSFALNNKKARVELRYPDGKVASKMTYDKKQESVVEDEVYTKESGQWAWVAPETKLAVAEITEKSPLPVEKEKVEIKLAKKETAPEEIIPAFEGIVAGASVEENREPPQPQKISYKNKTFDFLNSVINYFLNKLFAS